MLSELVYWIFQTNKVKIHINAEKKTIELVAPTDHFDKLVFNIFLQYDITYTEPIRKIWGNRKATIIHYNKIR